MGTSTWLSGDLLGFQVKGASLMDVFETAGLTMLAYEYNTSTVGYERELIVTAEGEDLDTLLQQWLRSLLGMRSQGFIPGDLFVVEVGEPPTRRYGDTSLSVRGSARGRAKGDWLEETGNRIEDVSSCEVSPRRKGYEASVYLRK